jgi:hypothetical protein
VGVTYLAAIVAGLLAQAPVVAPDATAPTPIHASDALAAFRPLEVRLRKLHLVRPDLLQFPIPYDVVC